MKLAHSIAAGLLAGTSAVAAAAAPAQESSAGRIRPGAPAPSLMLAQAGVPAGVDTGVDGTAPSGTGSQVAQAGTGSTAAPSGAAPYDQSRYSLLPYTSGGYVGLNIGRPEYDSGCGADATLVCDDPDTAWRLYTGGMFNPFFGVELSYVDMGEADRAGGQTHSRGVDLSLVGRWPLAQSFSVFGKLGATYGRTEVSALGSSGLVTGTESGFGPSVGAGMSFDLGQQWSVLLEWNRHDFRFPGGEREEVASNSLGVKYLF